MIISLAEAQMHHSIRKYMDTHRIKLVQSQEGVFSLDMVLYVIALKDQQRLILKSTSDMLEQFSF
jgi:hypothetical protein